MSGDDPQVPLIESVTWSDLTLLAVLLFIGCSVIAYIPSLGPLTAAADAHTFSRFRDTQACPQCPALSYSVRSSPETETSPECLYTVENDFMCTYYGETRLLYGDLSLLNSF